MPKKEVDPLWLKLSRFEPNEAPKGRADLVRLMLVNPEDRSLLTIEHI